MSRRVPTEARVTGSGGGYDGSPDAYPGAGPRIGLVQAEFASCRRMSGFAFAADADGLPHPANMLGVERVVTQRWLDENDAGLECPHGNLPHRPQKVRKCECFRPAHQKAKARAKLRDVANECLHGRLPGDRSPACGCWGDEGKEEAA